MFLMHWKGFRLEVKSPFLRYKKKSFWANPFFLILVRQTIIVRFVWICTLIWSISLCNITLLQDSEMKPTD